MLDELYLLESEDYEEMTYYSFQSYHLHLNHNKAKESWRVGQYLFITYGDVAFEDGKN
jgi:hypothetical protein